jgi:8-oxo-dGTP pyrophosphatase MutT (NUDIX family)
MQFHMQPLTESAIVERLQRAYQPGVIGSSDGYTESGSGQPARCAAVLIPFIWIKGEWQVVFTRRTDTVEHHKGQVSFPGGGCDPGDASPEATALREAKEEIGLHPEDVRILGRLNDHLTITRYRVTPVVGVMPWPYALVPAPEEVAAIFTIPLLWLADPAHWTEQPFTPDGTLRPVPVVIYQDYAGERLWGISARMMLSLCAVLGM